MVESDDTSSNEQKAVAKGKGSLAINAARYANVTVYQYVTYAGDRVTIRETNDPSRCPYPGLETFRTSESEFFAGRENDVAELEVKLRDHDICGVIAASGAGKSSLVHAGLIPALAKRETEAWDVFAFKPGQEPLYGLARSMSGVLAEAETRKGQFDEIDATVADLRETPGRLRRYIEDILSRRADAADGKKHHVLIFVDQWEELYTQENNEVRDILVRELMDVAGRGLAKVLLTMRIDFMDDLVSKSTEFYDVLEPAVRILRPLSEIGRRAAIEKPAEVAGLGVPPELTSRLVVDLGKDEGTLPYLQFVLRQLWEKRDKEANSVMTATYDSMDGLKGAIGAHADEVFRRLSKEEQGLAKRILPRLANVSDNGITSRRLPFADFDEPARNLLRRLAEPDARLIVLSSATEDVNDAEIVAEVAHEALLDDWKTLAGWIADRKDFFRLRNKLEADAKTWIENKHRHDFLIPAGKPLLDAQNLLAKALNGELSKDLNEFVENSVKRKREIEKAQELADAEHIKRLRIRNRGLMALSGVFIVATIGAGYFWNRSAIAGEEAKKQRIFAEAALVAEKVAKELATDLAEAEAVARTQAEAAKLEAEAKRVEAERASLAESVARTEAEGSAERERLAREEAEEAHKRAVELAQRALGRQLGLEAFHVKNGLTSSRTTELAAALAAESWRRQPNQQAVNIASQSMRELPVLSINQDAAVKLASFSHDGKRFVTLDINGVAQLFETEGGMMIAQFEHGAVVSSVAFSPNNELIATAYTNGTAQLRSIETGKLVRQIETGDHAVRIVFSPDGNLLATAGLDGFARIFNARTGLEIANVRHNDIVNDISFSPDGKLLATASREGLIRILNAESGQEIARSDELFQADTVAFSPDGDRLAATGNFYGVVILESSTGRKLEHLEQDRSIVAHAFSPDGDLFATGDTGGTGLIRSLESGQRLVQTKQRDQVSHLAFSADGKSLAIGSLDGSVELVGKHNLRFEHDDWVSTVEFSPDGTRLLTASHDGTTRIFRIDQGSELARIEHLDRAVSVSFSPNGQFLATASWDGRMGLFFAETGEEIAFFEHGEWVTSVSFSSLGDYIVVGGEDLVHVVRVQSGEQSMQIKDVRSVHVVEFAPRTAVFATGDDDGLVLIYNAQSGAEIARTDLEGPVHTLAFSFDETMLAVGSNDSTARIFDTSTGKEIHNFVHDDWVNSIAFSPDGKKLATASNDNNVRIFDTMSGKELEKIAHGDWVVSLVFSPDGTMLATGSYDSFARLIDSQNGQTFLQIEAGGKVNSVDFSPNGTAFAFGDSNGVARIVDVASGEDLARVENSSEINTIAFSPDGSKLAMSTDNGTVQVIEAEIDRLFKRLCTERIGRNLSAEEWKHFLGDVPWRPTCANWK